LKNSSKPQTFTYPCIKVSQPIGDFFIASIDSKALYTMTYRDIRRIAQRDVEKYLGIQRPLDEKRVKEIKKYVTTIDACFPTSIIISANGKCCEFDEKHNQMVFKEYIDSKEPSRSVPMEKVAKILDGQHRLEGLLGYTGPSFQLNVSVFIDMDLANEANIFSTVNLKQTKVNNSLAYDLFDLAKARSPQKTCHLIAIALDSQNKSPFYKRIKRLGVSTEGRFDEKITQATLVNSLIKYISADPMIDRDLYLRSKKPEIINADESQKLIFRNLFIDEKDLKIAEILLNYFSAVKAKWPKAWNGTGAGDILNRSNGFMALMRLLRPFYLYITKPGGLPSEAEFLKVFKKINMKDSEFTADNFKPGTSGESKLYHELLDKSGIEFTNN
jgi:DGQHR domain-containing protein